ncbi:MAG: heavy metal-associated domain-containing protein [Edaphocola sp.]
MLFLMLPEKSRGQYPDAELAIDGLTCSQCSRSVEMQLRKLPFIQSVTMNLAHATCKLTFKKEAGTNAEAIAQAVTDAGFSLRYLKLKVPTDKISVVSDNCILVEKDAYATDRPPDPKQPYNYLLFDKKSFAKQRVAGKCFANRKYCTVKVLAE